MGWPITDLPALHPNRRVVRRPEGPRGLRGLARAKPPPSQRGFVAVGLLSDAARNGAVFFLGDIGSDVALGRWDRLRQMSPLTIIRSYVSLTLGGEAGRMVASGISFLPLVNRLPIVQSALNRVVPLFGAIVANEAVETGGVAWSALPKTAIQVTAASLIVRGGVQLFAQSPFITGIGKILGLVSKLGKATLFGAVVSTVAEFTLIKGMGAAGQYLDEQESWSSATDQILDVIVADQRQLAANNPVTVLDDKLAMLEELVRARAQTEDPGAASSPLHFPRLRADGYRQIPEMMESVVEGLARDAQGLSVRASLPLEAITETAEDAPRYRQILAGYYREKLDPHQSWATLSEQIAQYRRDRCLHPLTGPERPGSVPQVRALQELVQEASRRAPGPWGN